jgi:hypothetical protein
VTISRLQALRPVIVDVIKAGGKLLHLQGSNLSEHGLLLLSDIVDQVNKRGCLINSVNLSGISLLRNSRAVMASVLQLPLLSDLSLSNTKLGDAGLQLLLDLLLSLDKQAPIRSLLSRSQSPCTPITPRIQHPRHAQHAVQWPGAACRRRRAARAEAA